MIHLDLAPLYRTYRGLGKAAHRPDLMLAMVLFELRRGRLKPSQWHQDTQENYSLWWLGFGIQPSRTCWYAYIINHSQCDGEASESVATESRKRVKDYYNFLTNKTVALYST